MAFVTLYKISEITKTKSDNKAKIDIKMTRLAIRWTSNNELWTPELERIVVINPYIEHYRPRETL